MLSIHQISIGFGGPPLFVDATFQIQATERVALLGRNGTGKSSLLEVVAGRARPDAGTVGLSRGWRLGYLPQEVPGATEGSVYNLVAEAASLSGRAEWEDMVETEKLLEQMGLEGEQPFSELSVGLKRRVLLAQALVTKPDLLVLDEPTNDLDLETLELLEDVPGDYPGTVILVSHDRVFLDETVTELFVMEGDGEVRSFVGGYSDYLQERQKAPSEGMRVAPVEKEAARTQPAKARRFLNRERWELERLPDELEALERKQEELAARLASPESYQSGKADPKKLQEEMIRVNAEHTAKFARWEELEKLRAELEAS